MSEPATAALDTKVVSKNLEIHLVPMLVAFAEESRGGSPRDGTDIECEAGRQAGVRVPGSDGGTLRRGPWRGVDGGIDRDEGVWTIPAMRTKAKREHRVPLRCRALEIPDAAYQLGDGWPARVSELARNAT